MANPFSVNYVEKSYEDLFLEMLTAAYANGEGILSTDQYFLDYVAGDKDIENTIIMEISVHALILSEAYKDLTRIYNAQSLYKAEGDDLDVLGQMYFQRYPPHAAVADVTYAREEGYEGNITIPYGHQLTTSSETPVIFKVVNETVVVDGEDFAVVQMECTTTGVSGNVAKGEINTMVTDIEGISGVSNEYGAYGGAEEENDLSYRRRLLNWKNILRKGTYDAIVDAIASVRAVESFYMDLYWDGYGSTKIIIDPPLTSVINMVEAAVAEAKAVDEDITIVPVVEVDVDVGLIVNVSLDEPVVVSDINKERIETIVEQQLVVYLEGGTDLYGNAVKANGIGRDFVPFEAGVYLKQQLPEIRNLSFTYPLEPVTIESHEKAMVGTIEVSVI